MHHEQTLLGVFFKRSYLTRQTSFHLELDAVWKQNEVKTTHSEDFRSNFQCWHHIINKKLLNGTFKKWKIIFFDTDAFNNRLSFVIVRMTTEKFPIGSHASYFVLMSETFFVFVEYDISFGKRTKLTKYLNDIIKLSFKNNFDLKFTFQVNIFFVKRHDNKSISLQNR